MRRRSTRQLSPRARQLHLCAILLAIGLFLAPRAGRADAPLSPRANSESAQQSGQRCADDWRLVASIVIEARPDLSLAMVRKPAGAQVVAIGGRIDDFTLVSLEPDRAHFRSSRGAVCTMSVFSSRARNADPEPPPAVAPSPPEPVAEPKGKAMFSRDELLGGVRDLGGDAYRVSKPLFLRALGNPGGAASGAYFRAVERDGRSVGMEVRAVRDGSVLSVMGIRTGDVVRSVNGIGLDNPIELLGALRTAREADSVTLMVLRDGRERAFRYLIE